MSPIIELVESTLPIERPLLVPLLQTALVAELALAGPGVAIAFCLGYVVGVIRRRMVPDCQSNSNTQENQNG